MIPLTHIATGYLLSESYCAMTKVVCANNPTLTLLAVTGSVLPDIDLLSSKKLNKHHDTLWHSPIFWALITLLFILGRYYVSFDMKYIIAFSFGIFSHLFLDWFGGRTTGIRLLYPYSNKMYSAFKLNPKLGYINILPNKKNYTEHIQYVKYYFTNRFLIIIEISLIVVALLLLFL